MKKKFVPTFRPPVLVLGQSRTYIKVFAVQKDGTYALRSDGSKKPYRPTFELNRIPELNIRKERGEIICKKIYWWLSNGFYFEDFEESKVSLQLIQQSVDKDVEKSNIKKDEHKRKAVTVRVAMQEARRLKASTKKVHTNKSYNSHINRFLYFLELKGWDQLDIMEITPSMAIQYMDYYLYDKQCRNATYNNVIIHQHAIFEALKIRGYIDVNPFGGIKKLKKQKKLHRNFQNHEARIVLDYIFEKSKILFFAILLEYCCFIRPNEIRHLRYYHIDLENGLIFLPEEITKSDKDRIPVIPDSFLHFFDCDFFNYPEKDYLIFGKDLSPHPSKPCGGGTLYRKHKKILLELKKKGKLKTIEGLTFYSWKHSGITDAIRQLGTRVACDQAGHSSEKITEEYYHRDHKNSKMKKFENTIL